MVSGYVRSSYQEAQVATSPQRLVILLYDHAILAAERAATCAEAGDLPGQIVGAKKVQDILLHLISTLDHRAGPIAGQLDKFYRHCLKLALTAHVENDPVRFRELEHMLSEVREGWVQAELTLEKERSHAF